ncbi:MAG: response regulator [Spirochaetes bacterium]|nr:response regulator [Spirochaetota bacterium]
MSSNISAGNHDSASSFMLHIRPLVTSVILGLLGFFFSRYSLNFTISPFVISINWSYILPLLAGMAYGPRYALAAGIIGLGAFFPFVLWPTNGWANVLSAFTFVVWFVWQGWCSRSRDRRKTWWNHPFIAQIFYCMFFSLSIFILYPVLFGLNPAPWAPNAETGIPNAVLSGIVFKEIILTCLAVLVAATLLKSSAVKIIFGIPVQSFSRYNDRTLAASLAGGGVILLFHRALSSILIDQDFPAGFFQLRDAQDRIDILIMLCVGFITSFVVINFVERRCKAEESLEQSREMLRSTLSSMDDIVFTLDTKCVIVQYHHPRDVIAEASASVIGRHCVEVLPEAFNRMLPPVMARILAGGAAEQIEYAVVEADGGQLRYSAKLSCHYDAAGRPDGITVVSRDITAQKNMEEQLRHTQKMEAIGTLAGGIAHDFNNILTPIVMLAGMAKNYLNAPEKLTAALDKIDQAAKRAKELTGQILSFSRKSVPAVVPVRAADVVRECMKLLRPTIPATIAIDVSITSEASVMGDPVQLYQVVMNLCTNAYQAMEKNGGTLTVTLADAVTEPPAANVVLTIRDTGTGIAPEIREKIFEPYFTTKDSGSGTGLGLSVVHGIVTGMNGGISVESTVGTGSVFTVTLPAIVSAATAADARPQSLPAVSGSLNIFFVEDEPSIRNVVTDFFREQKMHVAVFSNGTEALRALEQDPSACSLLITDITMPGIDGMETARRARALRPDLRIILCTGFSTHVDRNVVAADDRMQIVEKPFDMQELLAKVRSITS